MNLKQLIKEVERLLCEKGDIEKQFKHLPKGKCAYVQKLQLLGIKQTVEAVDNMMVNKWWLNKTTNEMKDWQTLKKLLGLK